ncbi:MAG: carboxypeptidase-like regulatory domain-containing protein, partial [Cyclobacteriaceae bacterium]|nr:carboxypeptidase-like regulatory domain-containing protein [Cyclobacteriaceae bacterium]
MKRLFSIWLLFTLLSFGIKAQQIQLDTLVDLKFQGITLKQALHEISRQYGIRFSYSDSKIPTDNVIHADYTSIILGNLLTDMLQKNGISYSIIENQIVLFPFNTNQTITVRGKVIDELNGSPIPFAHISLSGTFKGTSSNEDGEFEISLTKLPSELLISHLSHEKKLIYVYNEAQELEINLAPSQMTLQEVTIKAKRNNNAIYQLVKKAYDRLSKSELDMKYGKAFYRQKSQREERYTEIFELFYDVKYTDTGIKDWAVQEGRYAFQNGNEYDIFLYNKNFTLLSRLFSIRQPATESYLIPVNPDVKKFFDLELKEVIKFDERFIGVISYKPKSIVNLPATTGELYIDIDNYQILKMKGAFTDASLKIIGLSDKNSAWDNYQLDFQISFIDDHSDQLLMDYIRINHSFDYYFKKELIGKINTSSLLTFYEHYTPVKNK